MRDKSYLHCILMPLSVAKPTELATWGPADTSWHSLCMRSILTLSGAWQHMARTRCSRPGKPLTERFITVSNVSQANQRHRLAAWNAQRPNRQVQMQWSSAQAATVEQEVYTVGGCSRHPTPKKDRIAWCSMPRPCPTAAARHESSSAVLLSCAGAPKAAAQRLAGNSFAKADNT